MIMTEAQLLLKLQATVGKKQVQQLAHEVYVSAFPVKQIIDWCFRRQAKIAFHAAWILEQLCFNDFDYFFASFSHFIDRFPEVENGSVKRHFTKILVYVLEQPAYEKQLVKWKKTDSERVVQALFEWLIDPEVKPGVKVWCIDALAILAGYHLWVREELLPTLEAQLPDAGMGLSVRVRRFLKKYPPGCND